MTMLLRLVSAQARARVRALVLALRAALRARAGALGRGLVLVLVLAVVGAVSFVAGRRTARPRVEYRRVIVPAVPAAPDTVIRWRERVIYRTVQAEQRAEAPGTGSAAVEAFCQAAAAAAATDTVRLVDTVRVAAARTPAERLALAYAGRYDGRRLELWSLATDGARQHETFRGVRPPYEWTLHGDSAIVRASRWWWLREVARSAPAAGAGALIGGAEGAALAGAACLLGRLVF